MNSFKFKLRLKICDLLLAIFRKVNPYFELGKDFYLIAPTSVKDFWLRVDNDESVTIGRMKLVVEKRKE